MKFQAGKTYRTRDGREARVYATDGKGLCPIHGAIRFQDGWSAHEWARGGEDFRGKPGWDLMPIKCEAWILVRPTTGDYCARFNTREEAQEAARHSKQFADACALVRIEYEEGEGL